MIDGRILIDPTPLPAGAVATVTLRDVALEDAAARVVASVRLPCGGARGAIPFRLAAMVDPAGDYALAAEVRRDGGARLRPGDLATTARHGWRHGAAGTIGLRATRIA